MITAIAVFIVLMTILIAYALYTFRKYRKMPVVPDCDKIVILNDKNFQQQIGNRLVLVDFWASWCVPCKMMTPVLNDLAEELEGKAVIGKLNVEQYQQLAVKYNVRNIPTMVLFQDGNEALRMIGMKSKNFLKKQIEQYYKP